MRGVARVLAEQYYLYLLVSPWSVLLFILIGTNLGWAFLLFISWAIFMGRVSPSFVKQLGPGTWNFMFCFLFKGLLGERLVK